MTGVINFVIVVATALLAFRIFLSDLHRRYRAFFCFLIFEVLRNSVLGKLDWSGGWYQKIWVLTEPVEWLFFVWVVLELYSLVLEDYQGLAKVGRWALIASVCVALLASGISLMAPSHDTIQGQLMRYFYVADRAVYFSLVAFLVTILGFLMQYPISLNRNVIVHSVVFSIYFLGNTVIYLFLSARGFGVLEVVKNASVVTTLAALGTWLVVLGPAGEMQKLRLRPDWMPGKEEDLVKQLNNLNIALLRATRK